MWPGVSVPGLYFSHPDSHYFGVGKIERWLSPILNYDPKSVAEEIA